MSRLPMLIDAANVSTICVLHSHCPILCLLQTFQIFRLRVLLTALDPLWLPLRPCSLPPVLPVLIQALDPTFSTTEPQSSVRAPYRVHEDSPMNIVAFRVRM